MPEITIAHSCLPPDFPERVKILRGKILRILANIIGIKDEVGTTIFFPVNAPWDDQEKKIVVRVDGLFIKPERTDELRLCLVAELGQAVRESFPEAEFVQCRVHPFDPKQGYWEYRSDKA